MHKLTKMVTVAIIGFSILSSGCGGTSSTTKDTAKNKTPIIDESNETNKTKNYPLSYTYGTGIMIEKYGSKNLSWINTTGTACLKYRIKDGVSIYDKGVEYCSNLVLEGIDTWRLPTEEEAIHFMAHVPINPDADQSSNPNSDPAFLIYPDDGQTCLFMASENSKNFNYVYTTNDDRNGSFYEVNRQTAGIRCVADNIEE